MSITDRLCAWLFDGAEPPALPDPDTFSAAAHLLDELDALGLDDPTALQALLTDRLARLAPDERSTWSRQALQGAGLRAAAVLTPYATEVHLSLTDRLCAWLFDDAPAPPPSALIAAPAEALATLDDLAALIAASVVDPQLALTAEARLLAPLEDLLRAHLPADVQPAGPRGAALMAERIEWTWAPPALHLPQTQEHALAAPAATLPTLPTLPDLSSLTPDAPVSPGRAVWPTVVLALAAAILFFVLRPGSGPTEPVPAPPSIGGTSPKTLVTAPPATPPSASDAGTRARPLPATAERPALQPIPAGTFIMGSPPDEIGRGDWEDQRQVTLTRAYYMARTEVTQGQWTAVMGSNPAKFAGRDRYPIETVSWLDAVRYVNALSKAEGYPTCYRIRDTRADFMGLDCEGYRLPTEAEWEYAARAGTTSATYAGDLQILDVRNAPVLHDIAWYSGNAGLADTGMECPEPDKMQFPAKRCGTHPVATRRPNAFGLYDMIGNVWEWTHDVHGRPAPGPVVDPLGAEAGNRRVTKGCGWFRDARFCRAGNRYRPKVGYTSSVVGFRPVRTIR